MHPVRAGVARAARRLLLEALRPVIRAASHRYLLRQPRPGNHDRALAIGSDPIRVLIVGAGLAVGYGTEDARGALPTVLAEHLAAALHRGVVVETRPRPSVRLDRTIELIGMAGAATFDVVVWCPTIEEAFRGGARRWARHLHRIVEHIRATGGPRVRVILMGLPDVGGDGFLQRVGASLVDDVNARIDQIAGRFERVEFLPVPSREIDDWDAPLFDLDYRRTVIEELVALLADRQQEDAARALRNPIAITEHVGAPGARPDSSNKEDEPVDLTGARHVRP